MWKPGRQTNSEYEKLTIFSGRTWLPVDLHLIRYRVGHYVLEHTDPIDSKKHHRLNVILRKSEIGGRLFINDQAVAKRVVYFRPDRDAHMVNKVHKGTRLVLSIGWVTK